MNKLKQIPEFLRFVMVGLFATGLHYGIYFVLQKFIQVNVAYTLGYVLSFVANFYLTAYFTFGQPHCHSGKFFISEVCFQTKVISLRSLYDSEE